NQEEEKGGEEVTEEGKKEPSGEEADAAQENAGTLQRAVKLFFGCLAAVACGAVYTGYLSTYHDRKFWFSNRQELEREISLQGGSGFYYYYFKHMLSAPSFEMGVLELTVDNRTISGETINAVERLSLYPEIITAFVYRVTESQDFMDPICFYIGAVFCLQALYVTALFVTSWVMSGTWVAGMLAVAWFVINKSDTTQLDQAIPLRENWALPYFSWQVAALTGFLSNSVGPSQELFCHLTVSATTFSFLLLWEHSHYVLFVQALCLLLLDAFDLVPTRKVVDVHRVYLSSLALVYVIRFQSPSLLGCPLLCLLIANFLSMFFDLLSISIPCRDFVTNFLLCQDGFQSPSQELFLRLTQASVLPFYLLVLSVCLISTLQTVYARGQPMKTNLRLEDGRIGEQPEVAYHVIHTVLFGGLAMVSEGLKYLWTPHVCMLTAFGVCSPDLWMTVFRWLRLRSIHPVVLALILSTAVPTIIGFSLWREYFPRVLGELSELQEIYDTDTVELVTWIRSQAPPGTVFGGSPQVMGVVKLCTGLAVTSLPLYFDIRLLRRSEDTCQVYARRSAEDVYKILTSQKTNYVILEDSLCNEYTHKPACRMKDLLDISNGHVVYDRGEIYSFSKHGRFCSEIKLNYSPYTNYFTRVFWNRAYHIYRVNAVISFQY
uniref:Dpy-19-like 4 n=1 Tax=Gadus morhua TaxID=8049 RepID=A0A8C4ZEM8_GADMO